MTSRQLPLFLVLSIALAAPVACKNTAKVSDKAGADRRSKDDESNADGKKEREKTKKKVDDDKASDDDGKPAKKPEALGYDAALKKARDLMGKKDFKGAIAAYDDACAARDDDALAWGERGYAKVLDKQYDAGLKDLDAALGKTDDVKLLGPIWYNIGLGKEGKGDKTAALAAYKKSDELRPTKAAKSRIAALGDKPVAAVDDGKCVAKIDRRHVAAKAYATWLDVYKALAAKDGVDAPDGPPTTAGAAKKLVCKDGCKGASPYVVHLGGIDSGGGVEVIGLADVDAKGTIHLWDDVAGGMVSARCGYSDQIEISRASPIQVHVVSEPTEAGFFDQKGNVCSPGTDGCLNACVVEEWTESYQYYDTDAEQRLLSVTESGKPDASGKHKAKVGSLMNDDGDLVIYGGHCDQKVKVERGKPRFGGG